MAAFFDLYPNLRCERQFFERFDIYKYSDAEFLNKYRISKSGFERLCDMVRPDCQQRTHRSCALSVAEISALGLRYFATGSFHSVIGETMGISQPATHAAIDKFCTSIDSHFREMVTFPTDADSLQRKKRDFYRLGNFPNVIGCVDGTHIPIEKPNANEQRFVNRKYFHSINVQCICEPNGRLTNVVAQWPGSCHDSYILRASMIWDYMEANPNIGFILGDSAYAIRPWLMTPIRNCSNSREFAYNFAHSKTRVTIENVFGRWKRRFPILKFPSRRRDISTTLRDIRVAAILHNFAIENDIPEPSVNQTAADDNYLILGHDETDDSGGQHSSSLGVMKRNLIVENYF